MRGIDISNHQADLKPSNLDIDFCICKATEGIGWTDAYCDTFIQDCINNNILWGFYHYARENEPEEEAEYFYNECFNYFNYGIPVLDYETENYDNVKWCERFLEKLHELSGVWAIIYMSASRCGEYEGSWIPEKCGLWVAGYPDTYTTWINEEMPYNTYPFGTVAIWQFTSSLRISGYDDVLDGDIAYMDKTAWMKYANSTENPQNGDNGNYDKSIDDYVLEVLLGEYGTGEDRKRMLGDKYDAVQDRINELYKIAEEVLEGKWGNGWNRENALNGAGYPYKAVQLIVNALYAEQHDYNGC